MCLLLAKVGYNPREYIFRFCSYKRETELEFFFNLFLIGRYLLYNIVLVSALHQHQPAIGTYIYMSPPLISFPSPISSHLSRLSQSMSLSSQSHTAIFLFNFKVGHKAAETTRNIINASGPGNANECTVQLWFKKFCRGDEHLE